MRLKTFWSVQSLENIFGILLGLETDPKMNLTPAIFRLWEALEQEPMLAATSEDQRQEARKAVERAIFSEVKTQKKLWKFSKFRKVYKGYYHPCSWVIGVECWTFLYYADALFADLHGGAVPQHWGGCVEGLGAATAHRQALRGGQPQSQGPQDPSEIPVWVSLARCTGIWGFFFF